jgi:hypothetical protein
MDMNELESRLDAIERLLARVIANQSHADDLDRELETDLPVLQYGLKPEEAALLPHLERILDLARQVKGLSNL